MKANELRIGNWLHFDNFLGMSYDYQVTPRMFRQLGLDLSENIDIELNNYHRPIPLTEEWLVKFGFSDITEHCAVKVRNQKEFCISFFVDNCTEQQTMFVTLGSKGWTFKRVGSPLYKHVHQLQNLYFALTGEELTIKNEQR